MTHPKTEESNEISENGRLGWVPEHTKIFAPGKALDNGGHREHKVLFVKEAHRNVKLHKLYDWVKIGEICVYESYF